MSDAAGEAADGLHLLGLTGLFLELAPALLAPVPLGHVARDPEHEVGLALRVSDQRGLAFEQHPVPVLVAETRRVRSGLAGLERARDHGVRGAEVLRVDELGEVPPVQLLGRVAEDRLVGARREDDGPVEREQRDRVGRRLEHAAVELLALAQRRLRLPPLVELALRRRVEARILERERGEAPELLEQLEVVARERRAIAVADAEHAEEPAPRAQRHACDCSEPEVLETLCAAVPLRVRVDGERVLGFPHPAGETLALQQAGADERLERAGAEAQRELV